MDWIYKSCDDFLEVFFLGLSDIGFGFNFSGSQNFNLFGTPGFFNFSFELFFSLSLWISLGKNAQLSESEVWLVLNQVLLVVIGKAESTGSVTTESSSESVKDEVLSIPSVLGGDESSEISSGNVWFSFMINVQKQLFSGQQLVDSEFSGFDGHCWHKTLWFNKNIYFYLNINFTLFFYPIYSSKIRNLFSLDS